MENSDGKHDEGGTSKKWKSLDLHGVHEEKSEGHRRARTGNAKLYVSGGARSTEEKVIFPGQWKSDIYRRRDISRGVFQSDSKRLRKDFGISSPFTNGLDLRTGKPHNLNGSCSGPCISQSLYNVSDTLASGFATLPVKISKSNLSCSNVQDPSTWGGDIKIPRRPRGVLRRRNSPFNIKDAPVLFTSIGNSSSGPHSGTLSSDLVTPDQPVQLLVGNQNERCDEFVENGPSGCDSLECCKSENGNSVQAVQKRAQRNHRKRQYTTTEKLRRLVTSQQFEDSAKCSNNCHEDDEESLEQNAARMLSSRFDPRCTGISDNKSGFSSRSSRKSSASASASSSLEIAGRVLRPRKHNEKGSFRKRRHFYEVCSAGVDPYWVLKRRIRVFWPLDKSWYFGLVKNYDPKTKLHHVKYDDRDEEWINLQNERFKLLLLPSEFSCKFDSEKLELKANEESKHGIVSTIDDNCTNNFLESEPIISWLARSAHRVKKSSHRILKEKRRFHLKNNLHPSQGIIGCPLSTNSRRPIIVMPDRSTDDKAGKVTPVKTKKCCDDSKFTIVYFRRRFHKQLETVEDKLEESLPWSLSDSMELATFHANGVRSPGECNVTFTALKQVEGTVKCILSFLWPPSLTWLYENSWLYKIISLHYHGKLMMVWPVVRMEIVFLDNRRGLRFLTFTGYLQHAVAVMFLFIRIFHQPSRCTKFSELQLPFVSIGFRLSGVQGGGRQLLFYVYNFLDMMSSQWLYLGRKLKQFAVTVKELPLSECTYVNVKNFCCASEKRPSTSNFWEQITMEILQNASCRGFIHHLYSNISASSHTSLPYFKLNEQDKSHAFLLSFATIPAMFLVQHFKLLVEKNEDSVSSKISNAMPLLDCPDNYRKFTDECCSPVEDSSDQFSETTHENLGHTLNHAVVSSRWLSCPHSKLGTDALSMGNDCNLMRSSDISLNNVLNLNGNSAVHGDLGKRVSEESDSQFQRHPFSSKLWQDFGNPCSPLEDISSPEESEGDCSSFLNTPTIQTQRSQSEDNVSERGEHALEKSASYLSWSVNGCTKIHSPKPTAPRTIWHHNRQNHIAASVVNHSKFWPEDWEGYINGYKKPWTQVSYISPFGGRSQSHHQKGRPSKKLKTNDAKRTVASSKGLENDPHSLICNANVLVTAVDRGWREYGAHVSLESDDHKDWQILVKLSGATKYSCKAHQFWQPGTTNRFTHAMMWKGGKDWTLEFIDRSQWSLFKELYEECYNRNIRAASIRNIPIPGVRLIEDCDDFAGEVPFSRNSAKYFRQIGTEVEMALDPSHVLYDMDSEDEEWISELRNSADDNGRTFHGISDDTFEKAMNVFEKVAFAQHCNEFTDAEIESFMAEVGPVEAMKVVHEHWQQKRQKKGMPLIRQYQPALWEQYQQQVKEWNSTVSKMHNWSNGCNERAFSVEKPPMFAFCLRPRGLEVPNKGSKQRSHKKFPVNGHHSAFARENYSFQGKKLYGHSPGKEKALVTVPNCEYSDVPWLQSPTSLSHRDPASGFTTFANGGSDRSHHLRLERNNSKKVMSASPRDHRMMSAMHARRTKSSGIYRLNTGFPERLNATESKSDGFHRHQSDIDEFVLRDASSAAQHASNMAKLKREKAQWLIHKADLAIHRAVVALITADAMKASEEDMKGDG